MPRPKKCRKVCRLPVVRGFAPMVPGGVHGTPVPDCAGDAVRMTVDEFETVRLIDKLGFSQEECGCYMQVARATVQQVYAAARRKLAEALVDGRPLMIEGGDFELCDGRAVAHGCGECLRHRAESRELEEFVARMRAMACDCVSAPQGTTNKEERTMKVAIPLDEDRRQLYGSFGRAPYFLIGDVESGETEVLENPAADAESGAGPKATQFVLDQGVGAVATVQCGGNASQALKAAGVAVHEADGSVDGLQNFRLFRDGKLPILSVFHAGFHGQR